MKYIKLRKRFKDFQNYLSNAPDEEREAAITIVRALDTVSKKKQTEILKKVVAKIDAQRTGT